MTTITVDNTDFEVELVKFADIQAGDKVIHTYDDTSNYSPVDLWMGVAEHGNTSPRQEWYGPERIHATQNQDGTFTTQAVRNDDDYGFLIVATWHETETGHCLYRVI